MNYKNNKTSKMTTEELTKLNKAYLAGNPFPHTVIDNFADSEVLESIVKEFNEYEFFGHDTNSTRFQSKKFFSPYSPENLERIPPKTAKLIEHFNSQPFIDYLEKVTGIAGLKPDLELLGGGMHRILSGGKLSIHADSSKHANSGLYRRVNFLLYLNKNWNPEWGGTLQFYDKELTLQTEVQPIFNRAVIFNTTKDSYHGHPYELKTPEGVFRDSIALYYYTEEMPLEQKSEVTSAVWKELPKVKNSPSIVFATMCKNEEHCILETLKSVAPYIDYWVVCDTGSTDKTIELVKSFFKERNISGELYQDEWVGFDHNKTLMMERAKGKADYIMHLDADDLLVGDFSFEFPQVFDETPIDFKDAYLIRVKRGTSEWKALIMFNGSHSWKFCGVAHTTIKNLDKPNYTTGNLSSSGFYISGEGIGSRAFDPKKYLYDAERLQKQFWDTLVNDSDDLNSRSVFYTAQSYMDYGMYREALQWNRLYLKLKDVWIEEVFEAHMRSSVCLIQLQSNLNEIIAEMESAIKLFPDRAEPYLTLGKYLNSISEWELAYGYLIKAHTLSLDNTKLKYILFINEKAYGKYINDELSVSCYWTGRYEEGLDYLLEILNDLEFESSKDRLLDNLKHFNNKLGEKN